MGGTHLRIVSVAEFVGSRLLVFAGPAALHAGRGREPARTGLSIRLGCERAAVTGCVGFSGCAFAVSSLAGTSFSRTGNRHPHQGSCRRRLKGCTPVHRRKRQVRQAGRAQTRGAEEEVAVGAGNPSGFSSVNRQEQQFKNERGHVFGTPSPHASDEARALQGRLAWATVLVRTNSGFANGIDRLWKFVLQPAAL